MITWELHNTHKWLFDSTQARILTDTPMLLNYLKERVTVAQRESCGVYVGSTLRNISYKVFYICIMYFVMQMVRCMYTVVGTVRKFRQLSHLYIFVCLCKEKLRSYERCNLCVTVSYNMLNGVIFMWPFCNKDFM